MSELNDFMDAAKGEQSNDDKPNIEFNIPGSGYSQSKKDHDPHIYQQSNYSSDLNELDKEYVKASRFNDIHHDTVDLSDNNDSVLAAKAAEEQAEIEKAKNQPRGKPSLLRLLMSFGSQSNKRYFPHHVALPVLLENNRKTRALTDKLNMQKNTYEIAVQKYETALIKSGFDYEAYKKESLLPYEYREITKKIHSDPEMLRLMGVVSESHNRLDATMKSNEMKDVMGKLINNELGASAKNEFQKSIFQLRDEFMPLMSAKKVPILDAGKSVELGDKAGALTEEIKKVTEALKKLFGMGRSNAPKMG